jgi:hypothetical protein
MSFSKTQKCLGVIVSVAMLGFSVAKADIKSTIQNAKSGSTVPCSGSYTNSGPIYVPSGVIVRGPATFYFTTSSSDGFIMNGTNSQLQILTITGAKHGVDIKGSSCIINGCTVTGNYDSGIELDNSGSKNNTVSGCRSYNNADSSGGNADGFAVKNGAGSGNKFLNCTAYQNSDDGFDFYGANGIVIVSGCQAYNNGSYSGKTGNGNGYKMGGTYNIAHSYISCTAHNNTAGSTKRGFDTNRNTARITLTTCHSYSNGSADKLGNCVLSNCTMQN